MTTKANPDLVPQATAARAANRPRQRVAQLIKQGRLTVHKVHGENWVSLEELRQIIAQPRKAGRPRKTEEEETAK